MAIRESWGQAFIWFISSTSSTSSTLFKDYRDTAVSELLPSDELSARRSDSTLRRITSMDPQPDTEPSQACAYQEGEYDCETESECSSDEYTYQLPLNEMFRKGQVLSQVKELSLFDFLSEQFGLDPDEAGLTYTLWAHRLKVFGTHNLTFLENEARKIKSNKVIRNDMVVSDFISYTTGQKYRGGPYDVGEHSIREAATDERIVMCNAYRRNPSGV
ncbi:hypothetical protein [Phaffia rhodozyma]|uniref:Uncharacterized protein n=1 Tax=Phaffia rhodozyma TaxID=264483 RepID=A0A0F7SQU4_PHARH|nr:hypothetical protein [Phaffia rhodozyma]